MQFIFVFFLCLSFFSSSHSQHSATTNTASTLPITSHDVHLVNETEEVSMNPTHHKIAYLTFDDGPSDNTPLVLDTLKKENVKATFFVVGSNVAAHPDLLKQNFEQGNAIGNHTYSHDPRKLYTSPDAFYQDFKKSEDIIYSTIGIRPSIFRCPTGSVPSFTNSFREYMGKYNYVFFDWNIDSGDSKAPNVPESFIKENTIKAIDMKSNTNENLLILMHDGPGHRNSALALPDIIDHLKSKGYFFDILTDKTTPIQFKSKR